MEETVKSDVRIEAEILQARISEEAQHVLKRPNEDHAR